VIFRVAGLFHGLKQLPDRGQNCRNARIRAEAPMDAAELWAECSVGGVDFASPGRFG
jgi:hypothetical protein